jgi:hypothetical protein
VNREYTGHGIGQEFHSLPFILHHQNGEPGYMLPGMAFTVEPAVCEGKPDVRSCSLFLVLKYGRLTCMFCVNGCARADSALGRRLDGRDSRWKTIGAS